MRIILQKHLTRVIATLNILAGEHRPIRHHVLRINPNPINGSMKPRKERRLFTEQSTENAAN